ncbi:MAG: MATE family efflux transporter [Clostridia bacterium]|nr:MATE family efflux transporter [Clostridia bacterium]
MFTRDQLTKLIVPLIVEQLLAVTVGVADTIMITSVGEAAVSGISFVDTINSLVIFMFSAVATGGAIVVSQYLGRKDVEHAENASKQLLYAVFSVAAVMALICFLFRAPILRLLFGAVDADVMDAALVYLAITSLSFPFLAVYNGCAAVFRSMGNSKVSMRASVIMNIINIGGNAFLIFVMHWGAAGAATATLLSRAVAACLLLWLLMKPDNAISVRGLFRIRLDFPIIRSILRVGIPNGLESGMFHFGKLFVQSLLAGLGTPAIAANAICNSIVSYMIVPGSAMGLGLITVTGQCIGAGAYDQAKFYVRQLMVLMYAFLIAICAILLGFEKQLLSLFGLSAEALEIALFLFPMIVISHITVWPIAFPFANVLRAAGDVKFTMTVSIVSMWTLRIGLANLFVRGMGMGPEGIWYAMFIDWIARAAFFWWRYRSGKWMEKKVI